jgi:hypothetical protein
MRFQRGLSAGYGVAVGWPDDPESLLAGPRGRHLCWALVEEIGGGQAEAWNGPSWRQVTQFGSPPGDPAMLAAELAAAVGRADWEAVTAGMSDVDLVAPLAESVAWAMYWQPPDDVDQVLANPEVAGVLRPVARAVTRAPGARWWSSGVELGTQQHLEPVDGTTEGPALSDTAERLAAWLAATAEDERSTAERPADPAADYSGCWWSSPKWPAPVSTTRALPGLGALQLIAVEDWPGWAEVRCWPLAPRRDARIYEITGPGDWVALVARYPLEVTKSRRHDWWRVTGWAGTWLMPDYAAAASDYDAIHLSVGGYLTTAGRALPVAGAGCMLAGWDPDETYWLADVLATAGPPVRWINDDSAQLCWRPA